MAESASPAHPGEGETRRDFLYLAAAGFGVIGAAAVAWPVIHSMNPAADVLALASTEVDLSPIEEGQSITVTWRGKPIFIRRRTRAEIDAARAVSLDELRHPETDEARVRKPEWLILIGICTHLGCIPKGQGGGDPRGEFDCWLCPCHGSHFDTSGRIRKGPAPTNLEVPPYEFIDFAKIQIG
jgi:ubiquinol-cytochrome c reductase iron-sulfur subunit